MQIEPKLQAQLTKDFGDLVSKYCHDAENKQFAVEICELSCIHKEVIEDFCFKPLPIPSAEYKTWRFMHEDERKNFIAKNPTFYQDHIKDFNNLIDAVKNINTRNKKQLIEWMKLEDLSAEARAKVGEVLDSYSGQV